MPHMLNVIQQTVALGDTEGAKHIFDVFETLLILVRWLTSQLAALILTRRSTFFKLAPTAT